MSERYEVLDVGGHANLISDIKDYVDASKPKAEVVGGTVDTDTFLARETCRGFPVGSLATVRAIKGATVVWNQLAKNGNFAAKNTWIEQWSSYSVSDNVASMLATATNGKIYQQCPTPTGHKVYFRCDVNPTTACDLTIGSWYSSAYNVQLAASAGWQTVSKIFEVASGVTQLPMGVLDRRTSGWDTIKVRNYIVVDLTRMFGSGNEPSTVAEFEALYGASYYPYDSGTVKPASVSGVKAVGFNQWDEQWELGLWDSSGQKAASSQGIRSTGYIPVLPSTTYYVKTATKFSQGIIVREYDADKGFVGTIANVKNSTATMGANVHYIAICSFVADNVTSYSLGDICINISDPELNGTYRPYTTDQIDVPSITYFPDGMHGTSSAQDELTEDSAITRIAKATITSAKATSISTNMNGHVRVNCPSALPYKAKALSAAVVDGRNSIVNVAGIVENGAAYNYGRVGDYGYINRDFYLTLDESSITSLDDAKDWLDDHQPFELMYPLETQTEVSIGQPPDMTYRCEAGGTETITVPSGQISAPPTMEIEYAIDAPSVSASIAPQEGRVSSANYTGGSLVMLGGTLVKTTGAVAQGEELSIGTNCTKTTAAAEVAALS